MIRGQKQALEGCEMQMEALREEMAMQDERDREQEDDVAKSKLEYERLDEKKLGLQRTLQENVEEMMDLRAERNKATARIEQLETDLEDTRRDLKEARHEADERAGRVDVLETRLDEKTQECDVLGTQLKASEKSVHHMKTELERSDAEIEDLKGRMAGWDEVKVAAEKSGGKQQAGVGRKSFMGWGSGGNGGGDQVETLKSQLRERDQQIQSLDRNIQANNATIQTLKSNMVKMSSSFKQDDYLRRNQIAKLKQANAEYALKLHALQKVFQGINNEEQGGLLSSSSLASSSVHGGGEGQLSSSSVHSVIHIGTVHGSAHSAIERADRIGRAEAVNMRLGDVAASASTSASSTLLANNDMEALTLSSEHGGDNGLSPSSHGRKHQTTGEC